MNRCLWIAHPVLTLFLVAGCNSFSDNYTGSAFSASSHVLIDTLDSPTLIRYQMEGYRVIGSSTFVENDVNQAKIEKKAYAAGKEKGADVVLLNKEYIGSREEVVEVVTGYISTEEYNAKTGESTPVSIPEYKLETVSIAQYRYKGVFLRKALVHPVSG